MVIVTRARGKVVSAIGRISAVGMIFIGFFAVMFAVLPQISIRVGSSQAGYTDEVVPGVGTVNADVAYCQSCYSCGDSGCGCGDSAGGDSGGASGDSGDSGGAGGGGDSGDSGASCG